jgi:hypothetical protein
MDDDTLDEGAKILYARISMYSQEGRCWASNRHFAEKQKVTIRCVQKWLNQLKKSGYVKIDIQKSGLITTRDIWLVMDFKKSLTKRTTVHGRHEPQFMVDTNYSSPHKYKGSIKIKNNMATDEDIGLVSLFYEHLKKSILKFPDKSPQQLERWAHEMERLRRIDKRSVDEIRKVIEYLQTDEFWCSVVMSVSSLRKNFHKLYDRMMKPSKEKIEAQEAEKKVDNIKENKQIAEKILMQAKLPFGISYKIGEYGITINSRNGNFPLGYNENGFKDQLENALRKFGI